MKRHLVAGLTAALFFAGAAAAEPSRFSADRISEHIRVMSDDRFEGRSVASEGERLTTEYLIQQFRRMGLEPGGPDGSWVQIVELAQISAPKNATVEVTGPSGARPLVPGVDVLFGSRRPDGQVSVQDAPLVFAGYGIFAPERGWDDLGGLDVRGKVVMILSGEPDDQAESGPFDGSGATNYGRNSVKVAELLRRGAAGVVTINRLKSDEDGWKRFAGFAARPATDIVAPSNASRIAFQGQIASDAAARIFTDAGLDLDAMRASATQAGFKAVELRGQRLSVMFETDIDVTRSANVIARLPGRTRPEESILFTAHWDHMGTAAQPDADGDRIYNGAWDNASGVAAVLELARTFSRAPRTDRSVVFMALTAEEYGMLGSRWYGERPVWPLETTVAAFNFDMLPIKGRTRDVQVIGYGRSELEDLLTAAAARQGRRIVPDPVPEEGYFFRSDHIAFAERGVPALYATSGDDLIEGGVEVGRVREKDLVDRYYHQRRDEWRADFDFSGATQDLEMLYGIARDLANSDRWPGWRPTAEFNALRESSAAARR